MSRLVDQPLQSFQYQGHDGGDTSCVCCGNAFPGNEQRCQRCGAPLELSETVRRRGTEAKFVPVLGASGAGKTVYLGMLLDILNRGSSRLAGITQGAFSLAVQEATMNALARQRFPDKTPCESDSWSWVHCQVHSQQNRQQFVDLVTPDFAGEAIAHEIEQPGTHAAIHAIVAKARGVMLLCDAHSARENPLYDDFFAVKATSYLDAVRKDAVQKRNKNRQLELPVAIVLTKCDQCPELRDDPRKFAADHLTRLYHYCRSNLANHQFFCASVVGTCTPYIDDYGRHSEVAWHVEPRGIVEPLEWIMQLS